MSARVDTIHAWAAHLANLRPRTGHPGDVNLLGIIAGALFSLRNADRLGYRDPRGLAPPERKFFEKEFRLVLKALGRGDPDDQLRQAWRAGFYFISALVRLAPLAERLKLPPSEALRHLRDDVNWFKHRKKQHPVSPMQTSWDEALKVARDVCEALERRLKTR